MGCQSESRYLSPKIPEYRLVGLSPSHPQTLRARLRNTTRPIACFRQKTEAPQARLHKRSSELARATVIFASNSD